ITIVLFFFFSSRRRHTRLQGDWSSDMCSSDLVHAGAIEAGGDDRDAHLVIDANFVDEVRITVIATGFDRASMHVEEPILPQLERSEERGVGDEVVTERVRARCRTREMSE